MAHDEQRVLEPIEFMGMLNGADDFYGQHLILLDLAMGCLRHRQRECLPSVSIRLSGNAKEKRQNDNDCDSARADYAITVTWWKQVKGNLGTTCRMWGVVKWIDQNGTQSGSP
ncbi:hypothetical protein C7R93_18445 [Brevibacillus fortis]|uniref:Uncharacterized protein n=1 Tax=Brevibacillus fortis TaxID=2126352 RepID=A0A2P7V2Q0_9BACL|nr:hypothetical protein C7R93_18445 [Brevibacillus fortis]